MALSFYVYSLVPLIKKCLKLRNPELVDLRLRNSVIENESFNFLLSDIDTTLIIKDGANSYKLLKDFLFFKKIFIMLDFPEIYTETEFLKYEELMQHKTWKIVELFWFIRKINWCKRFLLENNNKLNALKMNRSIFRSLNKVLKNPNKEIKKSYFLSELKYMDLLFETSPRNIAISCYSDFLANNNCTGMTFEVSRDQYLNFNSLFPGDRSIVIGKNSINNFFSQCKVAIEVHEKLITSSSIRLKSAQGESVKELQEWLSLLA
jgi:hypothetical protein